MSETEDDLPPPGPEEKEGEQEEEQEQEQEEEQEDKEQEAQMEQAKEDDEDTQGNVELWKKPCPAAATTEVKPAPSPPPPACKIPVPTPARSRANDKAVVSRVSPRKEPAQGQLEPFTAAVPEIGDQKAKRPSPGECTLSPDAMRARSRRVFTPRANGTKKVSAEVFAEWHRGRGDPARRRLELIFQQCGYDPDKGSVRGFMGHGRTKY